MKTVSALKSDKTESPKTPGGISKTLLTPCRRVGLSRNWKKPGHSPFISPITVNSNSVIEVQDVKRETRKRKQRILEENEEECEQTAVTRDESDVLDTDEDVSVSPLTKTNSIVSTPTRNIGIPRKKKSKPLVSNLNDAPKTTEAQEVNKLHNKENTSKRDELNVPVKVIVNDDVMADTVATPVRSKSKNKVKTLSNKSPKTNEVVAEHKLSVAEIKENMNNSSNIKNEEMSDDTEKIKKSSPKELTKECIVVIQKKIFKTDRISTKPSDTVTKSTDNQNLHTLEDSDGDDVPLSHLNKIENENSKKHKEIQTLNDDDDFIDTVNTVTVKKLDKNTSTGSLKSTKEAKKSTIKNKNCETQTKLKAQKPIIVSLQSSQNSSDDDDFDFENKKTILIRKTYDKVAKLSKARSTGSITQKDIDELKGRIEMKKKILLAKAMTKETGELRTLVKRWQKGCQDALMELMELMKNKFPDKQNFDYSELLQTLRIPSELVGYDAENECFNTPDDASIILSKFNDI